MTALRKYRLLVLATTANAWHKRWYWQYCELLREGLVGWQLGTAFLTPKGKGWLEGYKAR